MTDDRLETCFCGNRASRWHADPSGAVLAECRECGALRSRHRSARFDRLWRRIGSLDEARAVAVARRVHSA